MDEINIDKSICTSTQKYFCRIQLSHLTIYRSEKALKRIKRK